MINYISCVLENNLVISKIMLDHAMILLAVISFNDEEIRKVYEKEQHNYEEILLEIIPYSYNKITKEFISANILVTDYTDLMASKTCNLFKVSENPEIYLSSQDLITNSKYLIDIFSPNVYLEVKKFNNKLLNRLIDSLDSLKYLYKKINDGIVTLFFPENFIEHLIEETKIYIYTLNFLNKQMEFTPTYAYKCKYYFNIFLKQHAVYLKNMIFPVNFKYCDEANIYINDFNNIADEFDDDISPKTMGILNNHTKETNEKFINYITELIQNILHSKYYAAAIPLLNEHILRESNYITYQLNTFNTFNK